MEAQEDVRTTRTLAPNDLGGRLDRNFDLTTPELPCGRVTRLCDSVLSDGIPSGMDERMERTPRSPAPSNPESPALPCRRRPHAAPNC